MTRLAQWMDRAIEGLWLAALVYTPLFFNVYSSRVFEPDKVALLRAIVALAAVCWAIKTLEHRRVPQDAITQPDAEVDSAGVKDDPASYQNGQGKVGAWWRAPLVLPLLLYAGWYLVSSLTSVDVYISIFGSYQRQEGFLTQLAYIVLGLIILFNLRTRAQVERIITFCVATAAPAALYGLMQHQGWDPLPWAGDVTTRVAGPAGNATAFGNWLVMVAPLILYRIVTVATWLRDPANRAELDDYDGPRIAIYTISIAAQSFVLWLALALIASNQRPDFGLWFILPTGILIFYALTFLYANARMTHALATTALVALILLFALVVAIIFYTQSRGPLVALVVEMMVFALAALWLQRSRVGLSLAGVACAAALLFLVVFNLPSSPLASLREMPYVGRLGVLTQFDIGSGKVLASVWQGTANMLISDTTRLAIGYGPETTYLTYNPYYPAGLQNIELRNATPDMSHDWILDQLAWGGIIMLGLLILLIFAFYSFTWQQAKRDEWLPKQLLLVALGVGISGYLVTLLVSHFTVATYTYFFAYLGLAVAVGYFGAMRASPPLATKSADESPAVESRSTWIGRRTRRSWSSVASYDEH